MKKTNNIKFENPLSDFKDVKTKMTRKEYNELNLKLREANAEVAKIEYKTELETKNIFIDGFVI